MKKNKIIIIKNKTPAEIVRDCSIKEKIVRDIKIGQKYLVKI